jgi:hypothetical protein
LDGVRIDFDGAAKIVHLLAESMGLRAISRFTGHDLNTVMRVLETAGQHCASLLDTKLRNLRFSHVEVDEVFSYIGKKPDKVEEDDPEFGAFFTFLSVAAHEKLIINWRVAKRTGDESVEFLSDLKRRMNCRFQLTTDAFRGYVAVHGSAGNVSKVFGDDVDYATETKRFTKDPRFTDKRAYFAPKVLKIYRMPRIGAPDLKRATTNHCERTNLSLRTFTRRFVRSTLNFSKKLENHRHAVAIFVAFFNFCRAHKSLGGKTPAMAAGLTDHVWTVVELLERHD